MWPIRALAVEVGKDEQEEHGAFVSHGSGRKKTSGRERFLLLRHYRISGAAQEKDDGSFSLSLSLNLLHGKVRKVGGGSERENDKGSKRIRR